MSDFMKPGVQEFDAPHLGQAKNWFQNLEPAQMQTYQAETMSPYTMRAQQMETPDTPLSQRAASRMERSVSQHGPDLERFYYGQMMGGGPSADYGTGLMRAEHDRARQDTMQQLQASGIPMQSSAMARTAGESLGQMDNQFAMQMGQYQDQLRQQELQNRMMGAQGLEGMGGYYAQPTSIEQAIFGMRSPYDMANFQAQQQAQMANMDARNQAGMANMQALNQANQFGAQAQNQAALTHQQAMTDWMTQLGMYQPQRMETPSPFQSYVMPFLEVGANVGASRLFGL